RPQGAVFALQLSHVMSMGRVAAIETIARLQELQSQGPCLRLQGFILGAQPPQLIALLRLGNFETTARRQQLLPYIRGLRPQGFVFTSESRALGVSSSPDSCLHQRSKLPSLLFTRYRLLHGTEHLLRAAPTQRAEVVWLRAASRQYS